MKTISGLNGHKESLVEALPVLSSAPDEIVNEFLNNMSVARIDGLQFIVNEESEVAMLPILLKGCVRVYKLGESGREITLYRVEKGGSCILSASCILSGIKFPAIAQSETEVEAVLVHAAKFREWVAKYTFWQNFVFGLLAERLEIIISVIEEVAFKRMDVRIASHLLGRQTLSIHETHSEIADELGTSREVVSRILKDFEHEGLIRLARGEIRLIQPTELREKLEKI